MEDKEIKECPIRICDFFIGGKCIAYDSVDECESYIMITELKDNLEESNK